MSLLIIIFSCWIASVGNWSVLGILEVIVAPMMAILLFFLPVIAVYKVPKLKAYKNFSADLFVLCMGAMVMMGFLMTQLL